MEELNYGTVEKDLGVEPVTYTFKVRGDGQSSPRHFEADLDCIIDDIMKSEHHSVRFECASETHHRPLEQATQKLLNRVEKELQQNYRRQSLITYATMVISTAACYPLGIAAAQEIGAGINDIHDYLLPLQGLVEATVPFFGAVHGYLAGKRLSAAYKKRSSFAQMWERRMILNGLQFYLDSQDYELLPELDNWIPVSDSSRNNG